MTLPALADLLPAGTRTPQSYGADESAGVLYVAQLVDGTETTGDIRISRHALSDGLLLDSMLVKGMGHAVSFGVEPMPESRSTPRRSWLWVEAPPLTGQGSGQARGSRISRVSYVPGRILWWESGRWVASDNPRPAQWMWDPYPDDTEITPQVCGDLLITRRRTAGGRRIAAHRLAEVLATYTAGDPAPVAVWDVPQPDLLPAPFQGYTYADGCVYLLTGGVGEGPFLTALDPATGAAITGTLPAPTWPEGFEAEGMAVIGGQVTYGTVRRTPRRRITIQPIPEPDDKESEMAEVWYPKATKKDLGRGKTPLAAHRINLHTAVSDATSLAGPFRDGPFSHFYVREDGVIEQYCPIDREAAADYKGNDNTISIETWDGAYSGSPGYWKHDSDVPPWTDAQLTALADLVRWIWAQQPQIPRKLAADNMLGPSSWGLSWHRLGVPCGGKAGYARPGGIMYSTATCKACPGDRRIAQVPAIFAAASKPPKPAVQLLTVDGVRGPKTDAAIDRQCASSGGTKALQAWLNTQMETRS